MKTHRKRKEREQGERGGDAPEMWRRTNNQDFPAKKATTTRRTTAQGVVLHRNNPHGNDRGKVQPSSKIGSSSPVRSGDVFVSFYMDRAGAPSRVVRSVCWRDTKREERERES